MAKSESVPSSGDLASFEAIWNKAVAAPEPVLLPPGEYSCVIGQDSKLWKASTGNSAFRIVFEVVDGEFVGKKLRHDLWLTEAAATFTKRDLLKIGVEDIQKLKNFVPPAGVAFCVSVVADSDESGRKHNSVHMFDLAK